MGGPPSLRHNRGRLALAIAFSDTTRKALISRLGPGSASDLTSGTLVVVPSITFPATELRKIVGIQYYEERLLFLLLLLKHPELRVVFVTSLRIEEPIVDYYLRFVPEEVDAGHRLYPIALWDPAPDALTGKLLQKDWALDRIKELATDGMLLTFNVTELEAQLAERVDIPLYGCPPDLVWLGSKSGSRKVARDADVPVMPGAEDLFSIEDIEVAITRIKQEAPDASACVIKLNNGFSGQGNCIIELDGAEQPLVESNHRFCAGEEDWDSFAGKIAEEGAIVEVLSRVEGLVSPSAQLRIGPDGSYEILSTHDQILGGPDDQVYLGCRFPARENYRLEIQEFGSRVAKVLASKGVIGSFGIDFLVTPANEIYLSEINLRMGGTTHPFLMMKFATGGVYESDTGDLIVDGSPRYYVSTDNLKSDSYKNIEPQTLIEAVDRAGLGFDPATKTGVTLHLLGAIKRFGKVGCVCISESREGAEDLYERFTEVLSTSSAARR